MSGATSTPAAPGDLDRLFQPEWAGGWALARVLFAVAAFAEHWRFAFGIGDAFGVPDMVFTTGWYRLADFFYMSPELAWAFWLAGMIAVPMIAYGGKWFRPGMILFAIGFWGLIGYEALNVKAHDRLLTWVGIGLFFSPAGERDLTSKYRSPAARYWLLIVYGAIYFSTGILKFLYEPMWITGEALQWHLVETYHAGNWRAAWVSGQRWLTTPMGWITLIFEIGFPFLVVFRKTNPWLLLMGTLFHLGLLLTMYVGAFAFVALSMYPVLLHPEVARGLYERFKAWRAR